MVTNSKSVSVLDLNSNMSAKLLATLCLVLVCIQGIASITIIKKSEWGGRAATGSTAAAKSLAYAVIHHSAGNYCSTKAACIAEMKSIQNYHMNSLGWSDIGYNYAIGGDGNIYEGRGYGKVGAHATNWNSKSPGIMFMGNYNNSKPTAAQIAKAKELLAWGVSQGYLKSAYTLYGHRQVGSTECPGNNLYAEIKKWGHWKA